MFKRLAIVLTVISIMSVSAMAQSWDFDKAHSNVGFSVRHMVIAKVRGSFTDYTGTINFDGKDMSKATVDVTIQMASINTDNEKRDGHLKSADFFDVEKYPTMTFKSKSITPGKDNSFTMVGDLTMKDVTKEVVLEGEMTGILEDPWGNTRAGFSTKTTINRQDFNVAWSNALKDGSLVVSNEVDIELEIELIQAK